MSLVAEAVVEAEKRNEALRTRDLRSSGFIPAVIYSKGKEAISIQLEYQAFRKAFRISGSSTILDVKLDGKDIMTLVHDIQYHPVSGDYVHLDLYQVTEGELVTATVNVVIEGFAPAVKLKSAVLSTPISHIEVRCLPRDLFHNVVVDVSGLENFHDNIKIEDLVEFKDEKIEILTDQKTVLAMTNAPKGGVSDEEDAPVAEAAEESAADKA